MVPFEQIENDMIVAQLLLPKREAQGSNPVINKNIYVLVTNCIQRKDENNGKVAVNVKNQTCDSTSRM